MHELRVPAELCYPEALDRAALQLEVGGISLVATSEAAGRLRPRVGSSVLFEVRATRERGCDGRCLMATGGL